jgi:hypothetical protein
MFVVMPVLEYATKGNCFWFPLMIFGTVAIVSVVILGVVILHNMVLGRRN